MNGLIGSPQKLLLKTTLRSDFLTTMKEHDFPEGVATEILNPNKNPSKTTINTPISTTPQH